MFPLEHGSKSVIYSGQRVRAGTQVRSGGWLGESIRTTDVDPMPKAIGEDYVHQADDTTQASVSASSIMWGHRYTLKHPHFIKGFELQQEIGKTYRVFGTKHGQTVELARLEDSQVEGVVFYPYAAIVAAGEQFDVFVRVTSPDAVVTQGAANYHYDGNKNNAPKAGYVYQTNYPHDTFRIHMTDADGNDQFDTLSLLHVGDSVSDGSRTWIVETEPVFSGSVFTFTVSPTVVSDTEGYKAFTFDFVTASNITYPVNENYWTDHGDDEVEGLFIVNGGLGGLAENGNAYGINIVRQRAVLSPDHILLSYSPALEG